MKNIFKKVLSLFSFILIVLVIASCSGNKKVKWEITDDDMSSAIELNKETIKDDKNLKLNIGSENEVFNKSISKDYVMVFKLAESSNDKILTEDYMKANSVKFSFKYESEKKITLEIKNYDDAYYTVLVNKKAMKDSVYGACILGATKEAIMANSSLELDNTNQIYGNQENPKFIINYKGYEVKDKTKISFNDAFNKLELSDVVIDKTLNQIIIETKGNVLNETYGTISLNVGFFSDDEIKEDIILSSNVNLVDGLVAGIDYDAPKTYIDLKLVNQTVLNFITKDDIRISNDFLVGSVSVNPVDKSLIRIEIKSDLNAKEINHQLNNETITISGDKLSANKDVNIRYIEFVPSISLRGGFKDNDSLIINVTTSNIKVSDLSDVEAYLKTTDDYGLIEETENGYMVEFDSLNITKSTTFSGTVTVIGSDIFGYDAYLEEPFNIEYSFMTSEEVNPQKFVEDVIEAEVDGEKAFASASMFILYSIQIGISFTPGVGNACAAISSVIQLLNFCGFAKGLLPQAPSIADVMNKLDAMDKKLDEISEKLDRLSETVKEESAAIQMGIDKALYVLYKNSWENFYNGSINELDAIIRNYGNAYRTYLVNLFKNLMPSDSLNLKIYYCNELVEGENKKVICAPGNESATYSTSGKQIIDTNDLTISASKLSNIIEEVNVNGYTDKFDEILMNDLKQSETSNISAEDLYDAIMVQSQKNVITIDLSNQITNAYCNFARGVYSNGNSQLNNFFGMVESLYCFQSEAKESIDSMRACIKNKLIVYGSFVSLFAELSGNQIDKTEVANLMQDACDFIKAYSGGKRNSNYSFITKTNISSSLLKLSFNAKFYNPGPGCEFHTSWTPLYYLNESTIGIFSHLNNQALVDQTALLKMRARFDILRTMNIDYVELDFEKYMIKLGILKDWSNTYNKLVSNNKGMALPKEMTIITQFDGLGDSSDTGNKYVCTSNGWGDYYNVGDVYQYKGSREKDCWSGYQANGIIFTFRTMIKYGSVITRYARYDEAHWYWNVDEHHAFELYSAGFITLAFYKC